MRLSEMTGEHYARWENEYLSHRETPDYDEEAMQDAIID